MKVCQLKYFLGMRQPTNKRVFSSLRENMHLIFCMKQARLDGNLQVFILNRKIRYEEESLKVNKIRYPRLVRKWVYLAHTRRYLDQCGESIHCKMLRRFYNISKSLEKEIFCSKEVKSITMEAYTYSNYMGLVNGQTSTFHYYTFLCGDIVTWRRKTQSIVDRSSVEA